jgi:lipoprotein-anchoring transpeptidase ErfK/SrfK
MESRIPRWNLPIYRQPNTRSPIRGRVLGGEAFYVLERVQGSGCDDGEGWGLVAGDGYVCLDKTEATDDTPIAQPRLVTFDHPEPDEYWEYVNTGDYEREPLAESDSLVPFIYAKRWRGWSGPTWSSLDAWNSGNNNSYKLGIDRKYHFVNAVETSGGTVLERKNGQVVPADEIFIYPVTRFHGRDLVQEPLAEGLIPAWIFNYEGGAIYASPEVADEPALTLDFHMALAVKDEPVDKAGHWWEIPDALGPGKSGYAHDQVTIRHWVARPPPEDIEADEVWLDVDRGQQVLALRKGKELLFVTLVSTGRGIQWRTPSGIFRIMNKSIYGDMASLPDAEEPYHVEKVPWVAYFWPRYAIHGAFWHWGFGHTASHGCINLSPRDARYIFDRLYPYLPNGWHTVYEAPSDPGMVLRVRLGADEKMRDLRRSMVDDRSASR